MIHRSSVLYLATLGATPLIHHVKFIFQAKSKPTSIEIRNISFTNTSIEASK
jgi:hypothetical protein